MTDIAKIKVPTWTVTFLDALRRGESRRAAAAAAGVSSSTPYHWRGRNTAFAQAWAEIAPATRAPRKGWGGSRPKSAGKRDRFIAALGETSNITAAAEAAKISLSQVYKLRREDPVFARRWFDALAEGYDNLEMELLQHLRGGEESERAGGTKAPAKKFDVATAFRCLAAHRESVAKEKGRRTLADEVATIAAINDKIDRLRLNGKAADKAIAGARKGIAARSKGEPTSSSRAAAGQTMKDADDGA